jgi:Glycosyl-transferase for dystroglycan
MVMRAFVGANAPRKGRSPSPPAGRNGEIGNVSGTSGAAYGSTTPTDGIRTRPIRQSLQGSNGTVPVSKHTVLPSTYASGASPSTQNNFLLGGSYYPGKDRSKKLGDSRRGTRGRRKKPASLIYRVFCSSTWRLVLSILVLSYLLFHWIVGPVLYEIAHEYFSYYHHVHTHHGDTSGAPPKPEKIVSRVRESIKKSKLPKTLENAKDTVGKLHSHLTKKVKEGLVDGKERSKILEQIAPGWFNRNEEVMGHHSTRGEQKSKSKHESKKDHHIAAFNEKAVVEDQRLKEQEEERKRQEAAAIRADEEEKERRRREDEERQRREREAKEHESRQHSEEEDNRRRHEEEVAADQRRREEEEQRRQKEHDEQLKEDHERAERQRREDQEALERRHREEEEDRKRREAEEENHRRQQQEQHHVAEADHEHHRRLTTLEEGGEYGRHAAQGHGDKHRAMHFTHLLHSGIDDHPAPVRTLINVDEFNNHTHCPANLHPDDIQVTLVVQSSLNRIWVLDETCRRWTGPIVAVVAMADHEFHLGSTQTLMGWEDKCPQLKLIPHKLEANQEAPANYPVNRLRNLGLDYVQTSHIMVMDVDFVPSEGLHDRIKDSLFDRAQIRKYISEDHRAEVPSEAREAIVVPAFERHFPPSCKDDVECKPLRSNSSFIPRTFHELRDSVLKSKETIVFQSDVNWEGHHSTKSESWLYQQWYDDHRQPRVTIPETKRRVRSIRPIDCFDSLRYEPYVVLRWCPAGVSEGIPQPASPYYDERFHGYGKNKIQHISHIRFMGYRFAVLPEGFIVHNPHPESKAKATWNDVASSTLHREMDELYPAYVKELVTKYRDNRDQVTQVCSETSKRERKIGREESDHENHSQKQEIQ